MTKRQKTKKTANDKQVAEVIICNIKGLHARAAAAFVKTVEKFDVEVEVSRDDETVSGHSILDLLLLVATKDTHLFIHTKGPDAEPAMKALTSLVEAGFNE